LAIPYWLTGRTIPSASKKKDFFGNTIVVDKDGKTIAKQKQDFFGNTILENEAGKTVGTQKKDFFGNSVLETESGQAWCQNLWAV
jgi:hypothetical protein